LEWESETPPLCFATQNIGEVARRDGGVENDISSAGLYPDISLHPPYSTALQDAVEAAV